MKPVFKSNGYIEQFTLGEGDLRFAVKDTLDVAGHRTRAGSPALANAPVAQRHADVVARLLEAQCMLTGKTTLHELAFGVTGINPRCGTPLNPHYPTLIPGGSSSGSAAVVASGEVDFSLGTDTGGSVRMPAACCGIIGLKPGFGVLSRSGVMPEQSSLDCVGVFARDADVLRKVMTRLAVPVGPPLEAFPSLAYVLAAEPDIDACIDEFLSQAGVTPQEAALPLLEEAHRAGLTLISHENWLASGPLLKSNLVSPDVASRIRAGADISEEALRHAEQIRRAFTEQVDDLLNMTPLLAMATLPELPPTLREAEEPLSVVNLTRLVRPFNLSGHPAITLPVGEIDGRPVALQLIARRGDDGLLVQAAGWLNARRRH